MTHKDALIIFIRYLGLYLLFRSFMTALILVNNLIIYGIGSDLEVRGLAIASLVSAFIQAVSGLLIIKFTNKIINRFFVNKEEQKDLNLNLAKDTIQEMIIFAFGLYLIVAIIPNLSQFISSVIELGNYYFILPFLGQVVFSLIFTLHRHKVSQWFNKFAQT